MITPSLRAVLLIAAACALASCANPNADRAADAQKLLVGMPKETLLSCAGVPQRSAVVENSEFLTYVNISYGGGFGPSTSVGVAGGSGGSGAGIGFSFPMFGGGEGYSSSCEATFTLRNNVVQQLTYTGSGGSSASLGQCYRIVENCLATIPPGPIPQR